MPAFWGTGCPPLPWAHRPPDWEPFEDGDGACAGGIGGGGASQAPASFLPHSGALTKSISVVHRGHPKVPWWLAARDEFRGLAWQQGAEVRRNGPEVWGSQRE